jgi:acyl carrier protein
MSGSLQAKRLLAQAVDGDPTAIPDDVRLGAFERWDSLAHLRLVLAIEDSIGRKLDPDESVRIETLQNISALLASK